MMQSKYEWVPKVRLGPIRFGENIQQYVDAGLLSFDPPLEELGGVGSFIDEDDSITVTPDDGFPDGPVRWVVEGIQCDKSILFNGQELLGLSIEDVVKFFGREPDQFGEEFEVIDDIQIIAEFDDFGLVLWFVDGVSVSASIDDGDYDDAEE
jgi:hypothetical protein